MKIEIIKEINNPLFSRKEIQLNIEADVTPSRKGVMQLVSKKFSIAPENIDVKKILGKFGSKNFKVNVHMYASKQDKEKIVPKSKKKETELEKKTEETKTEEKPSGQDVNDKKNSELKGEGSNRLTGKVDDKTIDTETKVDDEGSVDNKPD